MSIDWGDFERLSDEFLGIHRFSETAQAIVN